MSLTRRQTLRDTDAARFVISNAGALRFAFGILKRLASE